MFILDGDKKIYCETVKDILSTAYKLNKNSFTKVYALSTCINREDAILLYNHFMGFNNKKNDCLNNFTLMGKNLEFVENDNAYYFYINVMYDKNLTRTDNIIKLTNEIFNLGNIFREVKKILEIKNNTLTND